MAEEMTGSKEVSFIGDDIDQEIITDDVPGQEPMSDDEEGDEQGDEGQKDQNVLEIDMSNNSFSFFDGHFRENEDSGVTLVASHPSLPMVMTGGLDNTAYLWTTHREESTVVAQLTGHTESVVAGGFTSKGDYAVTGDMNGQIRVWKAKKRGEAWDLVQSIQEVEEIMSIVFHPSQNIFAACANDGTVWVYAIEPSLENIAVLEGHAGPVNSAAFVDADDLDNLSLVTVSDDFTIVKWNAYMATPKYKLGDKDLYGEHAWVSLSVSPTGKTYAVGASDGTLVIVNNENGNVLHRIDTAPSLEEADKGIESISWGPQAKVLAVGNIAGEIQLYDLMTWKLRKTLKAGMAITKLEFVPGTTTLFSSDYEGLVIKWNALSGERLWQSQGHNVGVLGFVLQDGAKRVITGDDEGVSLVFDTETAPQGTKTLALN
uniref:ARAD1C34518p n=1 Tax=Blastobotrys adeninivorans TaxID=409370 RepID=A0A060T923_BLAAD